MATLDPDSPLTPLEHRVLVHLLRARDTVIAAFAKRRVAGRERTGTGWVTTFVSVADTGNAQPDGTPESAGLSHPELPLDAIARLWFQDDGSLDYLELAAFGAADWPYASEDAFELQEIVPEAALLPDALREAAEALRPFVEEPPRDAAELDAWYEGAERFRRDLPPSVANVLPSLVWHFLSDADIGMRDPEHVQRQRDGVREIMGEMARGEVPW